MKEVKSKMESTKTPHGSCKDNDISSLDVMCVNTIRFLAADAVQKANSGHPGLPMGAAPIGYVLFNRFLKYNPKDPKWFNRDRFVLSAGHGSMLHYALLYLTGYDSVNIDEIKNFRQLGSKTPGHPENHVTKTIEQSPEPIENVSVDDVVDEVVYEVDKSVDEASDEVSDEVSTAVDEVTDDIERDSKKKATGFICVECGREFEHPKNHGIRFGSRLDER